ncbi:MAG: carbohydrate binding family 9 domain-containing protein, partial [Gemmatimonadota bacterium]|nr:carbohydrate binding family 9 domain-containing protein [Gemmatimonadota bacterium]
MATTRPAVYSRVLLRAALALFLAAPGASAQQVVAARATGRGAAPMASPPAAVSVGVRAPAYEARQVVRGVDTTTMSGHPIPVPRARAGLRTSSIAIDGRLDDAAWRGVEPVSNFTQTDPDEGQPASQRTEVRFLFDHDALYVGARMFDSEGARGVRAQLTRRDAQFDSDYFSIVLDGFHDHQSRAFFTVNPSGSRQDQIGAGNSCCDSGWDPIWESAAVVDSAGWSAELRIPLSQLRFSRDSMQTWGLQIWRYIQRRQEYDMWSFWKKTEVGGAARFGHLEGVQIAKQPRHLEVLPYAVARAKAVAVTEG